MKKQNAQRILWTKRLVCLMLAFTMVFTVPLQAMALQDSPPPVLQEQNSDTAVESSGSDNQQNPEQSPASEGQSSSEQDSAASQPSNGEDEQPSAAGTGSGASQPELPAVPEPEQLPPPEPEVIEIATPQQLKELADRVNAGDALEGVTVTLAADLSLQEFSPWIPIGAASETPFRGIFLGNGHTISHIQVTQEGGLFGYLADAELDGVRLSQTDAPQSTQGLFFAAANTTATNCYLKSGWLGLLRSAITTFDAPPPWNGNAYDVFWYTLNQSATVYTISTPAQLNGMSMLVNRTTQPVSFAGKRIIISGTLDMGGHEWTPIGTIANRFKGTLEGLDCVIQNLKSSSGGLFGYLDSATIKNVTLENAEINLADSAEINLADSKAGAFAVYGKNAVIVGCVLRNSSVKSNLVAAGIIGEVSANNASAHVAQCLVENSTITSTASDAAGIIGNSVISAISQNVVYGSAIKGLSTASGIAYSSAGPNGTYNSVSQNLVLHTSFEGAAVAGIIQSISGWNSSTNNFISDITSLQPSSTVYIGTPGTPFGIESFFTDSNLSKNLINADNSYAFNNYWDKSVAPAANTDSSKISGFETSYLTSGLFNVNDNYWIAQKNYYPRLSSLDSARNSSIASLAGLAAVPLLLPEEDTVLNNASGVILLDKTPTGDHITWDYTPVSGLQTKDVLDSGGVKYATLLYNVANDAATVSDLTASIENPQVAGGVYTKSFGAFSLRDVLLEEDTAARYPSGSTAQSPVLLSATEAESFKPKLTFIDPIEQNPNAGTALLERKRTDGSWQTVATVDCAKTGSGAIHIGPSDAPVWVEFNFHTGSTSPFQPGQQYRISIPAEAVKEKNKENYSEAVEFYVNILHQSVPVIEKLPYEEQYVVSQDTLALADLSGWFRVQNGSTPVSHSTGDLQALSNSWITGGSIAASVADIVNQLKAAAPASGVDLYYGLEGGYTLGSPFTAPGKHTFYVFAVNSDKNVVYRSFPFSVQGQPQWETTPADHQHLQWSDNKAALENWLAQTASGTYLSDQNTPVPVAAKAEINSNDWAANATADGSAFSVPAKLWLPGRNNQPYQTVNLTLYVDRSAYVTIQSTQLSAYVPQDQASVEGLIRAAVTEMPGYDVSFAHTPGADYSAAGSYTVQATFTPNTIISYCNTANCPHNNASYGTQTQTFTIELLKPRTTDSSGEDFWTKVANDTRQANDYVKIHRSSPPSDFPAWVMRVLQENIYNQIELEKDGYRWHFYGHTVREVPGWRVYYPLDVTFEEDKAVTALLGSHSGIQFRFSGEGALLADVGFDIKLQQESSQSWNLYRYDRAANKLVFVSDAILDGYWAQTVLDHIYDTTYVLSTRPYAKPNKPTSAEPGATGGIQKPEEENLLEQPQAPEPPVTEESQPEPPAVEAVQPVSPQGAIPWLMLLAVAAGATVLGLLLYWYNKQRKVEEDKNEKD